MLKKIIIGSVFLSGLLLAQSGGGININEDDFEIEGTLDSRNLEALQSSSIVYLADFNFLNSEDDKQESKLLGVGMGVTNRLQGIDGVELTFGAKAILANVDNIDKGLDNEWFAAVPLMGVVRYTFPPLMFNIPTVALESKVLYASKSLSFGHSKKYSELRFNIDIEMIENVKLYAGYRNIKTGFDIEDNEDYLFSNGFYGGLRFIYW